MKISNMKENRVKFYIIGRIPVKSLLKYLTVHCCINNISIILGYKIKFNGLIFTDKPLYNSLNNLIHVKKECS